ncbi:MAG: flavodoxin family protein [Lachnospiraceae bacterium]|nr:flavodoxin family protein [Lachnospiraceae bacterium]
MNKKVLIVSASFRKNSNSEMLAKAFEKGALESGNEVEVISLRDKSISFCHGCFACLKLGKCVIGDNAVEIAEKMKNTDGGRWRNVMRPAKSGQSAFPIFIRIGWLTSA